MTITLAAVYAPIGFMTGITGRLFTEFAWTLAGAVIVSGFVALTLSPMMCSKLLKHQDPSQSLLSHHRAVLERDHRSLPGASERRARGQAARASARPRRGRLELSSCFKPSRASSLRSRTKATSSRCSAGRRAPPSSTPTPTPRSSRRLRSKVPEADRVFSVAGNPTVSQGRVILRLKPWGRARAHASRRSRIDRAAR